MPPPFWRGYLKLSLVTCPVAMIPATTNREKVTFNTLNSATGNRVVSEYIDPVTGTAVADDEQVKGYQISESDYVMLEDDELDSVALASTHTIDISTFVPRDSIAWTWYDKPHYLVPDGDVGEEAFAVVREAMKATKTAGISRLVLYRREHAVMLIPNGQGIVVWTLRYGEELRQPPSHAPAAGADQDPDLRALVTKLIGKRTTAWRPSLVSDPVQARLIEIIAAKRKGKAAPKAKKEPQPQGNVVSILDALRKSLAEGKPKTRGRHPHET